MPITIKPDFSTIAVSRLGNNPNLPTIIFLHDSLGCIELWRDFPWRLYELTSYNVLVYDRQGYGKSCRFSHDTRDNSYLEQEADLLYELLEYWKINQAILFGHSDGGSIALIAAAKYPQKIFGVITEGAHVFVEDVTLAGIRQAMQSYETTDLKSRLEKYHGDKTDAMFRAWTETWTSDEFRSWNIEHFLPEIKCDLLVIQGEDDEFGTFEQVESIAQKSGGVSSKLVIVNVKHTPHKEVPELVLEKTSVFINQHKTR